jgi:prephenate dehydrogenase
MMSHTPDFPDEEILALPEIEELQHGEFNRIALIGVGMVGGSMGLALRESGYRGQITGLDKKEVLDEALALGAIDRAVGDLAEAVPSADLVVIATPVIETCKLLPTILRTAQSGAIVTDTGGAKAEVCTLASRTKKARGTFIGGHPLTGTARTGLANASAQLFSGAHYILTPLEKTSWHHLDSLKWWIRQLGASPLVLNPSQHDQLIGAVSHLPFLLALTLSEWIGGLAETSPILSKLAQGDFREMLRMLDGSYEGWNDLLQTNKTEILKILERFRRSLGSCESQLRGGNLTESFRRAHAFRSRVSRESAGYWDSRSVLFITAPDRPGTFARITSLLAEHQISIRDLRVTYVRETFGGNLRLVVASPSQATKALELLRSEGFDAHLKE